VYNPWTLGPDPTAVWLDPRKPLTAGQGGRDRVRTSDLVVV